MWDKNLPSTRGNSKNLKARPTEHKSKFLFMMLSIKYIEGTASDLMLGQLPDARDRVVYFRMGAFVCYNQYFKKKILF